MQKVFEKIIERLEEETDCPNCSMYCADANMCGFDEMRKQAIEIVNQAAEEYGDGWIPCSSGKFPNKTLVLCDVLYKDEDNNDFHEIKKLRYDGNGKFYNSWNDEQNVIAWQPLPAPYQPKEPIAETWKQQTMSRFERVE